MTDLLPRPEEEEEMKIDPGRVEALVSQIRSVRERIAAVAQGRDVRILFSSPFVFLLFSGFLPPPPFPQTPRRGLPA